MVAPEAGPPSPAPPDGAAPEPAREPAPATAREPAPEGHGTRAAPARRLPHVHVGIKGLIALLCAVLGFALVAQVRHTASGNALAGARPDDLVQILDGLQRREDDLNAEIADLTKTLGKLRTAGTSSTEALAEARRQAAALGVLVGTVGATGPGVRLQISDPGGQVPPEVLLDAIQELRNAGAEAFQVGDVRIGVDSAFTGAAGAIRLDGVPLSTPYTILAIGDPPTLAAAMAIPGGVVDTVRRAGASVTITQEKTVLIDALRQPKGGNYARPTG